jgi:hypothetical protein
MGIYDGAKVTIKAKGTKTVQQNTSFFQRTEKDIRSHRLSAGEEKGMLSSLAFKS